MDLDLKTRNLYFELEKVIYGQKRVITFQMESGGPGMHGQHAAHLVVADHNHEQDFVTTQHPLMVEEPALVLDQRTKRATIKVVQLVSNFTPQLSMSNQAL